MEYDWLVKIKVKEIQSLPQDVDSLGYASNVQSMSKEIYRGQERQLE